MASASPASQVSLQPADRHNGHDPRRHGDNTDWNGIGLTKQVSGLMAAW